jgi:hypothetical protein
MPSVSELRARPRLRRSTKAPPRLPPPRDRAGRKFLFLEGGVQMILCEVAVGILIHFNFAYPGGRVGGPMGGFGGSMAPAGQLSQRY